MSIAAIMRRLEEIREQNKLLMRELEVREKEVSDLLRICAELIARSEAFERDVQRRLDEMEKFQRESADRQG